MLGALLTIKIRQTFQSHPSIFAERSSFTFLDLIFSGQPPKNQPQAQAHFSPTPLPNQNQENLNHSHFQKELNHLYFQNHLHTLSL